MAAVERHPIPPIPRPPHASPPPPRESGGSPPPIPPPSAPGPSDTRHATLTDTGLKPHAPVYRVGSSQAPGNVTTTGNPQDVLAALQAWLAAHQQAVAASPGAPAPPATFNITGTAEPADQEGTPSGLPGSGGPPFKIGHGGHKSGNPFPPYPGAHGPQ